MTITLYHHPFSRAAATLWTLEEIGQPYELQHVDIMAGAQKKPPVIDLNPMGKVPVLVDGDTVVTENAAIALYLADRYASGRLAPKLDDPQRATYLRWSLFAPSVIEPGMTTKANGWDAKPGQVGWGDYASMIKTMEHALAGRDYVLGETFSMADVIFGGTIRFMLRFKLLEPAPTFTAYAARLDARPASQRADARNAEIAKAHGLGG